MDKNSLNTNKQFMIGNGMLAFGVFAVIIIFCICPSVSNARLTKYRLMKESTT